jgi:hypothetical protein
MKKLAGFLGAVAALVVSAPLAHANYVLSYQLDAGSIVNCANVASDTLATCFASPTAIGGLAGVTITQFTGTSNSPGTAASAQQTGSVVDITTTGAGKLTLWLAAQNFSQPVTPPSITDRTSLTIIPTFGTGSATLANCVDQSNGTAPTPGTFCSSSALTVNNSLAYSGTTALSNNNSGTVTSLASKFSLSEMVVITFTQASEIEIQTRQVLSSVPEPASIILLGTTTLGLISLLRKKVASRA